MTIGRVQLEVILHPPKGAKREGVVERPFVYSVVDRLSRPDPQGLYGQNEKEVRVSRTFDQSFYSRALKGVRVLLRKESDQSCSKNNSN